MVLLRAATFNAERSSSNDFGGYPDLSIRLNE
jgi:hypothetical protein